MAKQPHDNSAITTSSSPRDPAISNLDIGALDRRPRDPVRDLVPARIIDVRSKSVVEGCPVDILRMFREMRADRSRKVGVGTIRASLIPLTRAIAS